MDIKSLIFSYITKKNFKVFMRSMIKVNGKYRKIFTIESFDWCLSISAIKTNYISRLLINSMRKVQQNLTSSCPYFGIYKIVNWSPTESFRMIMPEGIYRTCVGSQFRKEKILEVCIMWEFY